ncbi:bluetail domain-containing putative surface protein, partial [Cyanobium sp. A1C-AMD]
HRDPQNGERTFLALNDSKVGFDTMNDAIIEITGFSGSLTALQVI